MSKHRTHIEQALAELGNAERHGSPDAALAAEKRLAAAGHKRAAAAKEDPEERARAPKGRTANRQSTTA